MVAQHPSPTRAHGPGDKLQPFFPGAAKKPTLLPGSNESGLICGTDGRAEHPRRETAAYSRRVGEKAGPPVGTTTNTPPPTHRRQIRYHQAEAQPFTGASLALVLTRPLPLPQERTRARSQIEGLSARLPPAHSLDKEKTQERAPSASTIGMIGRHHSHSRGTPSHHQQAFFGVGRRAEYPARPRIVRDQTE